MAPSAATSTATKVAGEGARRGASPSAPASRVTTAALALMTTLSLLPPGLVRPLAEQPMAVGALALPQAASRAEVMAPAAEVPGVVDQGLWPAMGSNDPHRTGCPDRGWRPPLRRPTYEVLLGHDRASVDELLGRSFMSMNEPPETDFLRAPETQASPAPLITSLDQVLRPEAKRKI